MSVREWLLDAVSFEAIPDGEPESAAFHEDPRVLARRHAARASGFRRCGLVRAPGSLADVWVHRDHPDLGLTISDGFYMLRTLSRSGESVVTFGHRPSAPSTERTLVRGGIGSIATDLSGHRAAARALAGPRAPQDSTAAWIAAERRFLRCELSLLRLASLAAPRLTSAAIHLVALAVALVCLVAAERLELVDPSSWTRYALVFFFVFWPLLAALKGTPTSSREEAERDAGRATASA